MKTIINIIIFSQIFFGAAITTCWSERITMNQNVKAGQIAEYLLEINNTSNQDQTYKLNSDGLSNLMNVYFTAEGPVLETLIIPANSSTELTAHIDVPINTEPGKFDGRFIASDTSSTSLSIPFSLNVTNIHSVEIISQTASIQAFSGQDFNFEVEILNNGISIETNVTIIVDAPAKWIVQLTPQRIAELQPGEKTTLKATVLIPASQVAVDQIMKFYIKSDFIESAERDLTVHVQKNPAVFIPLGVITLIVLLTALVYFKIKGRR